MKKKVGKAKNNIYLQIEFLSFSLCLCFKSGEVLGLRYKALVTKHSPLPSLW